jgi:hypothetical protein
MRLPCGMDEDSYYTYLPLDQTPHQYKLDCDSRIARELHAVRTAHPAHKLSMLGAMVDAFCDMACEQPALSTAYLEAWSLLQNWPAMFRCCGEQKQRILLFASAAARMEAYPRKRILFEMARVLLKMEDDEAARDLWAAVNQVLAGR